MFLMNWSARRILSLFLCTIAWTLPIRCAIDGWRLSQEDIDVLSPMAADYVRALPEDEAFFLDVDDGAYSLTIKFEDGVYEAREETGSVSRYYRDGVLETRDHASGEIVSLTCTLAETGMLADIVSMRELLLFLFEAESFVTYVSIRRAMGTPTDQTLSYRVDGERLIEDGYLDEGCEVGVNAEYDPDDHFKFVEILIESGTRLSTLAYHKYPFLDHVTFPAWPETTTT